MTWTAPKTDWSNGDLVTAADLNAIGENVTAIRNLPKATSATTEEIVKLLGDFADVDSANLNLTLSTAGGDVMVHFHGSLKRIGSANWTYARFDFDIDGTQKGGVNGIATVYMTGHFYWSASFTHLIQDLSPGSHTFNLKWKGDRTVSLAAGAQFWAREV
ncbi:MAG: hypothetical protein OXE52_00070 [Chloroflexi bacterium]|nr:hypothetical protein [Chloroflexota bacterium]